MEVIDLRIIIAGILFIISTVFGIWLSHMPKPLNVVLFSIHKISAALAIVLTAIFIYYLQINAGPGTFELSSIIITGLFLLILSISGVLLSFDKPVNNTLLTIHKVSPVLTIISVVLTIYLLASAK